jgi:hypothetical protein
MMKNLVGVDSVIDENQVVYPLRASGAMYGGVLLSDIDDLGWWDALTAEDWEVVAALLGEAQPGFRERFWANVPEGYYVAS